MKKVGILFILFFAFASLQLHAQKLTPLETKRLGDHSKELSKNGSENMLEFMSTGDTTFYNKAINYWQEAKAGYQRAINDGTASSGMASITASFYDISLTVVDTKLSIYGSSMKEKILSETDKDRTKKIKAGGKEYRVSKYCQSFASSLAKDLK
jgi:hypothetical protein